MADDWQPGDLALCVDAGNGPRCLRAGAIYTVEAIAAPAKWKGGIVGIGLVLAGNHHPTNYDKSWHPSRFRKIRPHTPDAEDRETIALLNGKPALVPVRAGMGEPM